MNDDKKNRKYYLLMGLTAGILYGIGDILLGYFGQNGTAFFGGVVNTELISAPTLQFELSFIIGLIAAFLMGTASDSMVLYLKDWTKGKYPKMLKLFTLGMKIAVIYTAAAHSVCCIAMMCIQTALNQGLSVELIETVYRLPLLIPFLMTNIWITISELLVSIPIIYFTVKKVIKGPKIFLFFNPICMYIIMKIIGALMLILTKDALFKQLFAGGASFGYGLMFLSCYLSADKIKTK